MEALNPRILALPLVFAMCVFALLMPAPAAALTIEVTRFGTCITPPGCSVTITDNGPGDLNPAPGVIDFSQTVGILPDGVFMAAGRAIETVTRDTAGRVSSILLTLTNAAVQGLAGGVGTPALIAGEIGVLSNVPIVSLDGVSGFASLVGQYQGVGFASVTLEARVDGGLLGRVVPPSSLSVTSFAGMDARTFPFPVDNLLIGTLDFDVAPGAGFLLPTSGDAFAAVPETGTLLLVVSGALGGVYYRLTRLA